MSREAINPSSMCMQCEVTLVTVCPLAEIAYKRGLDGMAECEMSLAVKKVVESIRHKARYRPKASEK